MSNIEPMGKNKVSRKRTRQVCGNDRSHGKPRAQFTRKARR